MAGSTSGLSCTRTCRWTTGSWTPIRRTVSSSTQAGSSLFKAMFKMFYLDACFLAVIYQVAGCQAAECCAAYCKGLQFLLGPSHAIVLFFLFINNCSRVKPYGTGTYLITYVPYFLILISRTWAIFCNRTYCTLLPYICFLYLLQNLGGYRSIWPETP